MKIRRQPNETETIKTIEKSIEYFLNISDTFCFMIFKDDSGYRMDYKK